MDCQFAYQSWNIKLTKTGCCIVLGLRRLDLLKFTENTVKLITGNTTPSVSDNNLDRRLRGSPKTIGFVVNTALNDYRALGGEFNYSCRRQVSIKLCDPIRWLTGVCCQVGHYSLDLVGIADNHLRAFRDIEFKFEVPATSFVSVNKYGLFYGSSQIKGHIQRSFVAALEASKILR